MFTVYKKLITPETSPLLGPAVTPKDSPILMPNDVNVNSPIVTALNHATTNLVMEPFSLCNYCCSPRTKMKKDSSTTDPHDSENQTQQDLTQAQDQFKPDFEFGHATHYKYNATTPRMICAFETGTPP